MYFYIVTVIVEGRLEGRGLESMNCGVRDTGFKVKTGL